VNSVSPHPKTLKEMYRELQKKGAYMDKTNSQNFLYTRTKGMTVY
jgi:hypothetical protein